MADTDTQTPNTADAIARLYQQLMAQPAPTLPAGTPNDGTSPSWTGLLGRVLGGGQAPGYQLRGSEADTSGNRALLNFGINTLLASGPHAVRPDLLSSVATGLQGAQESASLDQSRAGALAAAQFQAQREGRQDQLARIKEAIPLLQLMQNREALKGMPGSLLGGNTTGSIGAVGNGPPDPGSPAGQVATRTAAFWSSQGYTPEQVAGIMAGGPGAESSFNPGAKGDSGDSHGLYQHQGDRWAEMVKRYGPNPTEAQQNEFAAWEISPQGTHADVGAQLRAAKTPQEAAAIWTKGFERPKNADAQAAARAGVAGRYLGYGAAPPATPGQAPAPRAGGIQVAPEPPLATTAPNQTAQGPEEGTVQVAGKVGAPTSGVIPASPPGSAQDVADIQAGMANAQATPLVHQPGAVVTAQAGGQPPDPNSFEAYRLAHPIAPPAPEQRALFDAGLTPDQQNAHDTQLKALEVQYQAARAKGDPTAAAAAQEKLVTLETATSTLRENARKLAVEKQAEYFKDQDKQRFDAWTADRADRRAQEKAAQDRQQKLDEIAATGLQTRLSTAAGAEVERGKAVKEALDKDSIAASGQAQSLGGLQALSDNVDDSHTTLQSLATIKYGGTSLLNHLANAGIVPKGDAGPIQMLQSGISGAITQLRAGIQMGSLSDRDLSFIESMGPSLYEDKATRTAVIKYLQQAAYAKMRFNTIYNEEITRPGTNPADALERSRNIMDAKHPIVPQMPAEVAAVWNDQTPEAKAARTKWAASNNVRQNSLVRQPDGSLMLLK